MSESIDNTQISDADLEGASGGRASQKADVAFGDNINDESVDRSQNNNSKSWNFNKDNSKNANIDDISGGNVTLNF
jgi:hypothetical protein